MRVETTADDAAERLTAVDAAVERVFDDHRSDPLIKALGFVGEMGDQPQLRLISGMFVVAGLLASDSRLSRAGARMLVAHEVTTLAKDFVKKRVDRTRPRSATNNRDRKPRPGRNTAKEVTSFPSGHTAGAVAVAQAFAREYPEYRRPAWIAAGLVAAAQVPKCAHYLTDVGAGGLIGLLTEAVIDAAWPSEGTAEGIAGDAGAGPHRSP